MNEPTKTWKVIVEVPEHVSHRDELADAIADTAFAWEEKHHAKREDWDIHVYGGTSEYEIDIADRLAAALLLALHDAHPMYANSAGWRGGIGGQSVTPSCSFLDPPPGHEWTQYDLLSRPAREWMEHRGIDLDDVKKQIKDELASEINDLSHE